MKLSKIAYLSAAAFCCWTMISAAQECRAQSISDFRRRLAEPEVTGEGGTTSRVQVTESQDAAAAVARSTAHRDEAGFQGYRVGLYSGNDSHAQENSLAAKETFERAFPDINVYWVYDNPYFKVTAGDCLTEEEAVMLLARVRRHFPKAYVVRAAMTVDNLIIREREADDDEVQPDDEA